MAHETTSSNDKPSYEMIERCLVEAQSRTSRLDAEVVRLNSANAHLRNSLWEESQQRAAWQSHAEALARELEQLKGISLVGGIAAFVTGVMLTGKRGK